MATGAGKTYTIVNQIYRLMKAGLARIREFRNRPQPTIAVTVDLLTTGVDIPDLEYLVLPALPQAHPTTQPPGTRTRPHGLAGGRAMVIVCGPWRSCPHGRPPAEQGGVPPAP